MYSKKFLLLLCGFAIVFQVTAQSPGLDWDKSYDNGYWTSFKDIKQTDDNGFIICGNGSEEGTDLYEDILLIKIDAEGNTEWEKRIGEPESSEYAYSMLIAEDGGYILAGKKWKNRSILLVKTNSNGELEWEKEYYTDASKSEPAKLIKDQDNNYYITGYAEGITGSKGEQDAFQIKTNSSGEVIWSKNYGGTSDDCGKNILLLDDGGSVIIGWTMSFGVENYSAYFVTTGSDGNEVSKKIKDVRCNGGMPTYDKDYIIFGWQYDGPNSISASRIVEFDEEFNESWSRTFDDIVVRALVECPSGELILVADGLIVKLDADNYEDWRQEAGYTNNAGIISGDGSLVMVGDQDGVKGILIKTNPFISSAGIARGINEPGIELLPNPSLDQVNIKLTRTFSAPINICMFSADGKMVLQKNINMYPYPENITLDLSGYPGGIYMIGVFSGSQVQSARLIIQ